MKTIVDILFLCDHVNNLARIESVCTFKVFLSVQSFASEGKFSTLKFFVRECLEIVTSLKSVTRDTSHANQNSHAKQITHAKLTFLFLVIFKEVVVVESCCFE